MVSERVVRVCGVTYSGDGLLSCVSVVVVWRMVLMDVMPFVHAFVLVGIVDGDCENVMDFVVWVGWVGICCWLPVVESWSSFVCFVSGLMRNQLVPVCILMHSFRSGNLCCRLNDSCMFLIPVPVLIYC